MGKSYKKRTYYKQDNDSYGKKQANKKVRYNKDIFSGCSYKKLYCKYDICDCRYYYSYRQWKKDIESKEKAYLNGDLSCKLYEYEKDENWFYGTIIRK